MSKDLNDILQEKGNQGVVDEMQRMFNSFNVEEEKAATQAAMEEKCKEKAKQEADFEKKLAAELFKLPVGDLHNASRIYIAFGNEIRYNHITGFWGIFKGGVWNFETDRNSALYPYTRKIARIMQTNLPAPIKPPVNDAESIAQETVNDDEDTRRQKHNHYCKYARGLAQNWNNKKLQANAIELLKGVEEIIVQQADLDKHPMLLNVKNGVVDLETGKLYPAAPELLLTKQCNAAFNPTARAPVFEAFIEEILPDEETRKAVLRFLGYCLSGSVKEEKFLFVWGRGANGKGTLFQTFLKLLGSYGTAFNINALMKPKFPKDGEAATPEFAKLEGVRAAIAEEIPKGRMFDIAKVKLLSGRDSIPIRPLFQPARSIEVPTHKFIFSGNDLPRAESAGDDGFNRRLLVTKFDQQFTGNNADLSLKSRLEDSAELSGILNLLIAECLEWQKPKAQGGGLLQSSAMEEEKSNYLADNDWLTAFVMEKCELGENCDVAYKNLLDALKEFDTRARLYRDRDLADMLTQLEGVALHEKQRRGKYNSKFFTGIQLTSND